MRGGRRRDLQGLSARLDVSCEEKQRKKEEKISMSKEDQHNEKKKPE